MDAKLYTMEYRQNVAAKQNDGEGDEYRLNLNPRRIERRRQTKTA